MDWYDLPLWRNYMRALIRLSSRRRDFALRPEAHHGHAAAVDPEARVIYLDPALLPADPDSRFYPGADLVRERLVQALLTHEGGHIALSAPKPREERVGWLWNVLEDERMEREMVRRFPELDVAYGFLGDCALLELRTDLPGPIDPLNACLAWRYAHDRGEISCTDPERWARIRPLVEAAWDAGAGEVEAIARQINALLPPALQPRLDAGAGGAGLTRDERGQDRDAAPDPGSVPQDEPGAAEDGQETGTGDPAPARDMGAPQETAPPGEDEDGGSPGEAGDQTDPAPPDLKVPPRPQRLPAPPSAQGGHVPTLGRAQARMLDAVEALAPGLARVLAPPEKPARRRSSRSRGRLHVQRYLQGRERLLMRPGEAQKPERFLLHLLIDLSSSMTGRSLEAARQAALLVCRAGDLSGSRALVLGFADEVAELVTPAMRWEEARDALLRLQAGGGTVLSGALGRSLAQPDPLGSRIITVIISDGQLGYTDEARCRQLLAGEEREIIPLLIGQARAMTAPWRTLFGTAQALDQPEDISRFITDFLSEKRQEDTGW